MIIRAHIDAARRTHRIDGALITHNSDIELQLTAEEGSGFDLSEAVSAIFVTDRGSYDAVVSSTGSFAVPVLSASDGRYCFVGFQQGEVRTTTDAKFLIQRSIKDIKSTAADPQAASFDPIYGSLAESDYVQVKRSSDGKRGSATIETLRELMGGVTIEPYTNDPVVDGTASAGSSDAYARGDHVHPTDTSRASQTDLAALSQRIDDILPVVRMIYGVSTRGNAVSIRAAGCMPILELDGLVYQLAGISDDAAWFWTAEDDLSFLHLASVDASGHWETYQRQIDDFYSIPSGGIPKTDLASDVQNSLGKADTALQAAPVSSVNGQTGAVTLSIPATADDVGAIAAPSSPNTGDVLIYNGSTWVAGQAGLSNDAKAALLALLEKVAYIDEHGQDYIDDFEDALNGKTLTSITAVFTQGQAVIYDTDSLDDLKQYLVVTAHYSDNSTATITTYTLSGTLTAGTSTITVSYGGKTDTVNVTVTAWDFTWYATSGALPQGMTATSTTWATNNEYADIQNPKYNIGYADMEVEVECAWKTIPQKQFAANTQIIASSAEGFGAKIFAESTTKKVCFYGYENGSVAVVYPNVQGSDFHVYRLRLLNDVCELYVDDTLIAQRDAYSSQYTGAPIIYSADTSITNKLAIKSIKWRKLS